MQNSILRCDIGWLSNRFWYWLQIGRFYWRRLCQGAWRDTRKGAKSDHGKVLRESQYSKGLWKWSARCRYLTIEVLREGIRVAPFWDSLILVICEPSQSLYLPSKINYKTRREDVNYYIFMELDWWLGSGQILAQIIIQSWINVRSAKFWRPCPRTRRNGSINPRVQAHQCLLEEKNSRKRQKNKVLDILNLVISFLAWMKCPSQPFSRHQMLTPSRRTDQKSTLNFWTSKLQKQIPNAKNKTQSITIESRSMFYSAYLETKDQSSPA